MSQFISTLFRGRDFCHRYPKSVLVQVDNAGGTQCVQNSRQVLSIPSPVPFSCHMPKPVAPAVTCLCCHLAPAWPWRGVEGSSGWLLFCSLLGGITRKITRKAQGFVKCAGYLHPSFSGLACGPWSNRRSCHGLLTNSHEI